MKNLYFFLLILFCSKVVLGQPGTTTDKSLSLQRTGAVAEKLSGVSSTNSSWEESEPFRNGFARVYAGQKWGFINGSGTLVIQPQFQAARNFEKGLAAVKKNSKWGFIDTRGNGVIPFKYDIAYDFIESVTAVYTAGKWYLINRKGAILKALPIDIFWGFKNGLAKITVQGRSGIMNLKGDILSMEPSRALAAKPAISRLTAPTAVQGNVCPANIDFEFGNFTNWICDTGHVAAVGTNNVITVSPSPPIPNRHVLIPKASPSALDPYGLFPTNPPDGSNSCLKLGNNVNGAQAEKVSYLINVPAISADFSITYRYAVVFQDPGHLPYQQPRFKAQVIDVATNTVLPCASYEYISGSGLPGFFNSPLDTSIKCKSWASVFINLSAYSGKTLRLEFTTADCTKGAHWGYAYVDVGDCDITATATYQCSTKQALFTAPPGFEFYNWYDNNFTTLLGTGQNMVLNSPPAPGSIMHVIVIPYNGFGCSDTLEAPYTVSFPVAKAGRDTSVCSGAVVPIGSNPVSGYTYSWSPSNFLSNPNSANPTAQPTVSTTYVVTVADTLSGCTAQDTVTVNVNPTPKAAFDQGATQCFKGNSFTFNNTSSISSGSLTYNWTFGDGSTSTSASPVHSFPHPGIYSVKLVVTSNNGCTDSIVHPAITVNSNPQVKTNPDLSICRGVSTQLQTTGAQSYEWSPSTGLSCTSCANPIASPDSSATYFVKGNDNIGCQGYDTVNITVFQPIKITASPDISICAFTSANLMAGGGAATYLWSPAQSLSNPNIPGPVATPATTTQYQVVGFDGHSCFTDTAYVMVTLNPNPIAGFSSGPPQCLAGNSFTFTNSSSISTGNLSYFWNFGDGTTSTNANPVHSFANAGIYSVKLVVTSNNGCRDSIIHPAVTVMSNPPVKTSDDPSICEGNGVQLQTTGALNYQWSPASGLSCTNCANPVASPLVSSTYFVKGIDNAGCPGYDTVNITVFQPIQIGVSPGATICELQTVNLSATGNASSYVWSPAQSLSNANIPNPVASPANTTQYRVIGYDGHNCFTDTGYVTITVNPKPTINIGPDLNLSTGTIYQLNPVTTNGPMVSWLWSPPNDLSCNTCPDPSVTVKKNITYVATVTNIYGCTAIDSINISSFCEGSQVFIPNAFTPDGDGLNDILMVRAKGIQSVRSFRIFTRWGELVFEKINFPPNDPSYGWDGRIRGVKAPAEVYVYTAEVICDNMQPYIFKGNVTILK